MRSRLAFSAIDTHTEGMPARIITSGVGRLPGATMADRRRYVIQERDDLRRLLMHEPRGHQAMSGAILQESTRPDADYGVVFIEVSGCLPMCGHGAIGTVTALVETGMVEVTEPVTVVRLDTPAGVVEASVEVDHGRATAVTIRNVPSYLHRTGATANVDDLGEVIFDLAWGGNFYAILPAVAVGLEVSPACHDRLVESGLAIMRAVNEQLEFAHPEQPELDECRHVIFTAPGTDGATSRGAVAIHPGWLDRSPCGTGTSARMAQLFAGGELELNEDFVHESVIGTRFTGRVVATTTVGDFAAVVPTVRGRAWLTAISTYLLDPNDPFPAGFLMQERS
jgi:proline racemase